MANPEHLAILKQGVKVWNEWKRKHANIRLDVDEEELEEVDLSRANLYGAYLQGANLRGVNIGWTDLRLANLTGADLTDANLTAANLTRASLTEASFIEAKLSGADFTNAWLGENNFGSAIMEWTVLVGVDLSTARGLEQVRHKGPSSIGIDTLYLSEGKIPEIFLREAGVPDDIITLMPSIRGNPIEFYSVFISYSHADKSFARRLYDGLRGRGIRCWLDEHEILPGQKIHVEVDRGIRIWDKVLLCCSEHSLKSWWVNNEIELAIQKEQGLWKERGEEVLSLIPLNLDGYMFNPQWHSGWKGQIMERLAADFTGWEQDNARFEQQFERVVMALRSGDGGRQGPPKPTL